uniref:RING-CH-type domain-containing protein n=1 Tax=Timema bartmani TaxID=61472 RepID=A0A7R9FBN9_9NEOP|nr:unnamed protein product [Timema bartmani]
MAQAQLGDDVQNEVKVMQPEGKRSEGVVGRCGYCDPLENKKAEGVRQDSNDSLAGSMCRICHSGGSSSLLGTLKSPCYCRGTVALVHMACLERWLSASGTEFCELCGFRFRVERTPRHTTLHSLKLWLTTDPDSMQVSQDIKVIAGTHHRP